LPERLLDALLAKAISVTLVRGRDLLVFDDRQGHHSSDGFRPRQSTRSATRAADGSLSSTRPSASTGPRSSRLRHLTGLLDSVGMTVKTESEEVERQHLVDLLYKLDEHPPVSRALPT